MSLENVCKKKNHKSQFGKAKVMEGKGKDVLVYDIHMCSELYAW